MVFAWIGVEIDAMKIFCLYLLLLAYFFHLFCLGKAKTSPAGLIQSSASFWNLQTNWAFLQLDSMELVFALPELKQILWKCIHCQDHFDADSFIRSKRKRKSQFTLTFSPFPEIADDDGPLKLEPNSIFQQLTTLVGMPQLDSTDPMFNGGRGTT